MQQAFGQLGMQIAGDVSKRLAEKDEDVWGEGKPGRIALHAVISGLGAAMGGGNVAGAIGGTIAGDVATSLVQTQIEKAVAGLPPNIRDQVANVIANVVAGAAGGAVGGASGASGALFAYMYNRQLHPEEKALAKKVAEAMQAQGKEISADYIEAQMRQMGGVIDGVSYPGVPDVQIGGVNQTDAGATWFNEPGAVVFVQNTTKADAAVQALILDIINKSSVPNLVHYLPAPVFRDTSPRMGYVPRSDVVGRYCVTAECAAALVPNLTPLGIFNRRSMQRITLLGCLVGQAGLRRVRRWQEMRKSQLVRRLLRWQLVYFSRWYGQTLENQQMIHLLTVRRGLWVIECLP